MKSIYKYPLKLEHKQTITAPITRALNVQEQHGRPCMWAEVETEDKPKEWTVYAVLTGIGPMPPFGAHYLSTVQFDGGALVVHYFICEEDGQDD